MFFDIFIALCDKKGVSCTHAAKEMGLSNSITTKWKKTGATPGGETLDKVAAYFNVSTDYLLGKEEKEKSPSDFKFTEGEKALIELLRKLPPEERLSAYEDVLARLRERGI